MPNGLDYLNGTVGPFKLEENGIIINAFQAKSVLTQILFEPEPVLNDSITYDMSFRIGEATYPRESLIITRGGNQFITDFHQKVTNLANQMNIELGKFTTGYVDSDKDFGSSNVKAIKAPKIVLVGGEGTSSLRFGEFWFFLDKELGYPVTVLEVDQLASSSFNK